MLCNSKIKKNREFEIKMEKNALNWEFIKIIR